MTINRKPETEAEWRTHSLNIQGLFFEHWCKQAIVDSRQWQFIKSNYPVAYPRNHLQKEGSIDILAQASNLRSEIILLVECKKNNPEFIEWVFFAEPQPPPYVLSFLALDNQFDPSILRGPETGGVNAGLFPLRMQLPVSGEGLETRGNYAEWKGQKEKRTRTGNTAIYEASRQVTMALMSVHHDELHAASKIVAKGEIKWRHRVFIPVVVTTAKLFVSEFDPHEVEGATGEIDFTKVALSEVSVLVYKFPCPPSLQGDHFLIPPLLLPNVSPVSTTNILVVNSAAFKDFLSFLHVRAL